MEILRDYLNRPIRLTSERLEHILEHPEMIEFVSEIEDVIQNPEIVIQSKADKNEEIYYNKKLTKLFGNKWLCVIVKFTNIDGFILTAYISRNLINGEILWERK
jgi:hypothetical protein